jgi:hypothetical protein
MKLETRDSKAPLCLRPFWMGNLSVIYWSVIFVGLFKNISLIQISLMGVENVVENFHVA